MAADTFNLDSVQGAEFLEPYTWPERQDYFALLGKTEIQGPLSDNSELHRLSVSIPKAKNPQSPSNYRTCDPSFWLEFQQAQELLMRFFELSDGTNSQEETKKKKKKLKPLNCLILGPPGSGKTTVARKLETAINKYLASIPDKKKVWKQIEFLEYNLSGLSESGDLRMLFDQINGRVRHIKQQRLVREKEQPDSIKNQQNVENQQQDGEGNLLLMIFFDEFDVTMASSSMMRFLIQLIYDGEVPLMNLDLSSERVIFVFSGSYLKSRPLLRKLQRSGSEFDFLHFLFDTYNHMGGQPRPQKEIRDLFDLAYKYQDNRTQISPDRDALDYLKRLDKVTDFLSRINGFVMEVLDLSAPLEVTNDPLQVSLEEHKSVEDRLKIMPRNQTIAENVRRFVEAKELYALWDLRHVYPRGYREIDPSVGEKDPILAYKNMLLCERMIRVLKMIQEKFRQGNDQWIYIDRKLLNLLCMIPLVHGMRSLEMFISQLESKPLVAHPDKKKRTLIDYPYSANREVMRMHTHMEGIYANQTTLWNALARRNPEAFKRLRDTPGGGEKSTPRPGGEGEEREIYIAIRPPD